MPSFDSIVYDQGIKAWLCFESPSYHITASKPEEVLPALERVERLCREKNLYAVGYLPYEAAIAFDSRMSTSVVRGSWLLNSYLYNGYTHLNELPPPDRSFSLGVWSPSISNSRYSKAISAVKQFIRSGYTYQVNFTFRMYNQLSGDPYALFYSMTRSQGPGYSAYLSFEDQTICSASPELFFTRYGNELTCKPMKGTIRRGRSLAEDLGFRDTLRASIKDQAENVMIVDMTRNDLGRVCEIGSVNVPDLFTIEKYPTVWQMTTTVQGRSAKTIPEIFRALFPCASITGAPKISTMKIINELESTPRSVYCGTIGFIKPNLDCQFNVAIRTAVIEHDSGKLTYGIGGGVVWDSTIHGEYEEALLKAEVITKPRPEFQLKESILWEPLNGYFLLEEHLQRLCDSAEYFDYPLDEGALRRELAELSHTFPNEQSQKVRLLLDAKGRINLSTATIPTTPTPITRLKFAAIPIDPADRYRYHKTTLPDANLPRDPLVEDLIYLTSDEQVAETSIANIAVRLNGQLYTPPLMTGILPGTYRAKLIKDGILLERPIFKHELTMGSEIYLVNSVRKMWPAKLVIDNL